MALALVRDSAPAELEHYGIAEALRGLGRLAWIVHEPFWRDRYAGLCEQALRLVLRQRDRHGARIQDPGGLTALRPVGNLRSGMKSAEGGSGTAGSRARVGWRVVLRRWLLAAIGLLYVISIPWYRETGEIPPLLFGLPDWVTIALTCYVGVAVLNAIAWMLTEVSDGEATEEKDRP